MNILHQFRLTKFKSSCAIDKSIYTYHVMYSTKSSIYFLIFDIFHSNLINLVNKKKLKIIQCSVSLISLVKVKKFYNKLKLLLVFLKVKLNESFFFAVM